MKGREPDQPKVENQSDRAPNLAEYGPLDEIGKESRSGCRVREVVRKRLVGNQEL